MNQATFQPSRFPFLKSHSATARPAAPRPANETPRSRASRSRYSATSGLSAANPSQSTPVVDSKSPGSTGCDRMYKPAKIISVAMPATAIQGRRLPRVVPCESKLPPLA